MAKNAAEDVASEWQILYRLIWKCRAVSDGGIDDEREKERRLIDLTADAIVFDGDTPVGVRYAEHLFLFDDPATHIFWDETYTGYVGGWGEIFDISEYSLQRAAD